MPPRKERSQTGKRCPRNAPSAAVTARSGPPTPPARRGRAATPFSASRRSVAAARSFAPGAQDVGRPDVARADPAHVPRARRAASEEARTGPSRRDNRRGRITAKYGQTAAQLIGSGIRASRMCCPRARALVAEVHVGVQVARCTSQPCRVTHYRAPQCVTGRPKGWRGAEDDGRDPEPAHRPAPRGRRCAPASRPRKRPTMPATNAFAADPRPAPPASTPRSTSPPRGAGDARRLLGLGRGAGGRADRERQQAHPQEPPTARATGSTSSRSTPPTTP